MCLLLSVHDVLYECGEGEEYQQDDICSRQVLYVDLRFYRQPFADVAGIAALERKVDDGGDLDRDAVVG